MKKTLLLKLIILILGLALIGAAFAFWGPKDGFTAVDRYVWINALVAYCCFAAIFFSFRINTENADNRVYPVLFIVRSLIVFTLFTIVMIVLVKTGVLAIKLAIILQLVLLMIALLYILFAVISAGHIRSVAAAETKLTGDIDNLRAMMNGINVRASDLPEQYDGVKKSIAELGDDLRYLSPCRNQRAVQLEQDITTEVLKLENLVKFKGDATEMEGICNEIRLLIKERKAILN